GQALTDRGGARIGGEKCLHVGDAVLLQEQVRRRIGDGEPGGQLGTSTFLPCSLPARTQPEDSAFEQEPQPLKLSLEIVQVCLLPGGLVGQEGDLVHVVRSTETSAMLSAPLTRTRTGVALASSSSNTLEGSSGTTGPNCIGPAAPGTIRI